MKKKLVIAYIYEDGNITSIDIEGVSVFVEIVDVTNPILMKRGIKQAIIIDEKYHNFDGSDLPCISIQKEKI